MRIFWLLKFKDIINFLNNVNGDTTVNLDEIHALLNGIKIDEFHSKELPQFIGQK